MLRFCAGHQHGLAGGAEAKHESNMLGVSIGGLATGEERERTAGGPGRAGGTQCWRVLVVALCTPGQGRDEQRTLARMRWQASSWVVARGVSRRGVARAGSWFTSLNWRRSSAADWFAVAATPRGSTENCTGPVPSAFSKAIVAGSAVPACAALQ